MKIELNKEKFEKVLKILSPVIESKGVMPICSYALAEFSGDKMNLTATDIETTIQTFVGVENSEGELESFMLDVSTIQKTLASLKAETIFIEIEKNELTLTIPKSKKKYSMQIPYKAKDFPVVKIDEPESTIELNGSLIHNCLSSCATLINTNDLRLGFTGINVKATETGIQLFGGTGFAFNVVDIETEEKIDGIVIPKGITKVTQFYTSSPFVQVSLCKSKKNISFDDGSIKATVALVNTPVINYAPIIDNVDMESNIVYNREDLFGAIKRVSGYSNYDIVVGANIDLDHTGEEVIVRSENSDFGKKASEEVEVIKKNEKIDFVIRYSSKFLSAILNNLDGETITLCISSNNKAGIFHDEKSRGFKTMWGIAQMLNNSQNK